MLDGSIERAKATPALALPCSARSLLTCALFRICNHALAVLMAYFAKGKGSSAEHANANIC